MKKRKKLEKRNLKKKRKRKKSNHLISKNLFFPLYLLYLINIFVSEQQNKLNQ